MCLALNPRVGAPIDHETIRHKNEIGYNKKQIPITHARKVMKKGMPNFELGERKDRINAPKPILVEGNGWISLLLEHLRHILDIVGEDPRATTDFVTALLSQFWKLPLTNFPANQK